MFNKRIHFFHIEEYEVSNTPQTYLLKMDTYFTIRCSPRLRNIQSNFTSDLINDFTASIKITYYTITSILLSLFEYFCFFVNRQRNFVTATFVFTANKIGNFINTKYVLHGALLFTRKQKFDAGAIL